MNASKIRSITVRPPPGTRFSIFGADCVLQFQEGREQEVVDWLQGWIDGFVKPLIAIQARQQAQQAQQTAVNSSANAHEGCADCEKKKAAAAAAQHVQENPQLDAEENFQVANCLTCKKNPIKHMSGLCDACHMSARETLNSLPDDENKPVVNATENKVNENGN